MESAGMKEEICLTAQACKHNLNRCYGPPWGLAGWGEWGYNIKECRRQSFATWHNLLSLGARNGT